MEFVIIGTRQQLSKLCFSIICVGEFDIDAFSSVKNLGAHFDAIFFMVTHVTKMCGAAFFHLYNIKKLIPRIRKYLSQETLVHAFVTRKIDHCNSFCTDSLHVN